MGKKMVTQPKYNFVSDTNDFLCIQNFNKSFFTPKTKSASLSLVSSLSYIEKINPYANSSLALLQIEENFRSEKLRSLIFELAKAIDTNSISEIKRLKSIHGNTTEFAQAKSFLDKKCKEVWNVFNNKKSKLKIPVEAMKTLGISNQPTLDFLFENSLKYFEKENSTTTADIIKSTLSNDNINYTYDDIAYYLKSSHQKCIFEYNLNTVKFLAIYTNFNRAKLDFLEINEQQIKGIFKSLTIEEKFDCLLKYFLNINCK